MKKLLFILMLWGGWVSAQNTTTLPGGTSPVTPSYRYIVPSGKPDSLKNWWVYNPTTGTYNRGITFTEFNYYVGTATQAAITANSAKLKTTTTVLQQPTIGTVLYAGSPLDSVIKALYAPPQLPFVTFGSSQIYELTGNTTQSSVLSYSYGKVTGTSNLASADINGNSSGITQSINGASGTITENFSTNTTTTFTFNATTIDPLTRSVSITKSYSPGIYYGYSSGSTPTNNEILAVSGGAKVVANGHAFPNGITVTPSGGAKYPFIAIAHNQGNITQFLDVNAFDITTGFTTNKFSVTLNNGIGTGGYSQTYDVYPYITAVNSPFFFKTN